MLVDITYAPGTQKSPQQTKLSALAFSDTTGVHFPNGRLSTLPPYSVVNTDLDDAVQLIGAVRAYHAMQLSGTYQGFYELYGANNRLYARTQSTLYNITPIDQASNVTLGTDPLASGFDNFQITPFGTTNGSKIVALLTFMTPFLTIGDVVTISGVAASVNGIPAGDLNGTHTIINFDGSAAVFQVDTAANATGFPTITAPNLAFKKILVTHTAHGLQTGDRVKISGSAGTIGAIPSAEVNGEHVVVVSNANEYSIPVSTAPTSFANGGGAAVVERQQIAAGNADQTPASGWGTGIWGTGIWGIGGPPVSAQSYPRIWSFADFGNTVVMCPGDYTAGDGQKIYVWDGNLDIAPTVLTNAPTDCNWVSVVNNSVVALCGTVIKISQLGDGTVWSGLSYFSGTVQQAWKLISCHNRGEKDAVIFTPAACYLLQYVGGSDIWDVSPLSLDDGILSPYSAALLNTTLHWRGYRGSYSFDGSPVKKDYNAQNDQYITNSINYAKNWKSFAFADTQNNQWYHFYPSGADTEPGTYAIYNNASGNLHVTLGSMERTAAQRPGFVNVQFGMVNGTSEDEVGTIYRHFVDGPITFDWSATTALFYVDDGGNRYLFDQFMPDSTQTGSFNVQAITQDYAQSTQHLSNSYTIDSTTGTQAVYASGRVFGLIFSGSNIAATIGAWKMHVKKLGKR